MSTPEASQPKPAVFEIVGDLNAPNCESGVCAVPQTPENPPANSAEPR